MIKSLQSLRGIFALLIFLFHFGVELGFAKLPFSFGGSCGVSFFIMLSGFVMCAAYSDKVLRPNFNYKTFILKRISRIYPLHLLGFAISLFFLAGTDSSTKLLATNLLLIQSWIPSYIFYFSFNTVSWSLSTLLFCYITFPLVMRIVLKSNKYKKTLFSLIWLFIYIALIILIPDKSYSLYICPFSRLLDFIIGIILWKVYKKIANQTKENTISIKLINTLQICSVLILMIPILAYDSIARDFQWVSIWLIPSAIIILIFSLSDSSSAFLTKILKSRPLLWFGDISFSFFILHYLIIQIALQYGLPFGYYTNLFLILGICTLLAYISSKYIEKPLGARLNRWLVPA